MALVSEIKDGAMVTDKIAANEKKAASDDTKQMFLKLLVTEMQYQDPLEPSDNSQYVQELATFSQVEALNSVASSMNDMQAGSLVGNYVTITNPETGAVTSGYVDYVTMDGDEKKVSIDGELYDVDHVSAVQDSSFYEAGLMADTFAALVAKLPQPEYVTLNDTQAVTEAQQVYDSLNSYQQTFVSKDALDKLEKVKATLIAMSNALTEEATKKAEQWAQERETAETSETAEASETTEASETV